jgi:metal-responsive CopG/Arc/MetJ family transcriptional regulator
MAKKKEAEKKNGHDKVTIKIPRPLFDKLKVIIEGSGYNSVTDFIVFVLRDLVASSSVSEQTSEGEVEKIKQRLKGLGYL